MSVRSKILAAQHDAAQHDAARAGRPPPPTKVFLTMADETALEIELAATSYAPAHEIRQHGRRKALPRIYELDIVWGGARFGVNRRLLESGACE